ncbi:MAG: AMP-binding protein [Salipiger thiooxidans]
MSWTAGRPTNWARDADGAPATMMAALIRNAHDKPAHTMFCERHMGIWRRHSTVETLDEVLELGAGLDALGLGRGDCLTVIGDNRTAIYLCMLAAGALGAFPGPVYASVTVDELVFYTRLGSPRMAVAEDQEQVDKLLDLRKRTGGQPEVILYDDPRGVTGYSEPGLLSIAELRRQGREALTRAPQLAADIAGRSDPGEPCVLLYSSGTTGVPKGIPLTHRNVLGGVRNAALVGYVAPGDELFAYLPTAWVGDFTFTLGAGIALCATINVPERAETALHDMREVAPSFYLAAPRTWDAKLTSIQVGMADATPLKRRIYEHFMPRAIEIARKKLEGRPVGLGARLHRIVGELLIFGPLKDWLGLGRARSVFTGGEAIGEETFLFFRALGLPLRQVYGQTETCALTAAQTEERVQVVGVGDPLPGVELRIAEDGELWVRSVSVFDGYLDNPEASAEALEDGWLRTGDAAQYGDAGQLVVIGRVSEVQHTAGGHRFIPSFIENNLKFSQYIRNVSVSGEGREDLRALVCIDLEAVGHWAERRALGYTSYSDLSQKPEVYELIRAEIAHVNTNLPTDLRVSRFTNLPKDFDADDGEITRTNKLRRKVIDEVYGPVIESLYGPDTEVAFETGIRYEDGSKGTLSRTLQLREVIA